ncbi:ATP-binding protein [Bacillus sp. FSL W7-1360]
MNKLRNRLIWALMPVIVVVLLALGLLLGYWLNDRYTELLSERIEQEATLAAHMITEVGFPTAADAGEVARELGEVLSARVRLFTADDDVIADSWEGEQPPLEAEMRYGVSSIYEGEQRVGYVQVGVLSSSLSALNQAGWWAIGGSFFFAIVIMTMLIIKITRQMVQPIEDATKAAIRLAEGDYKIRTYEVGNHELGLLGRSINVLAYNLQQLSRRHQAQQEQMATLIDHMGSALLFMDVRGDIVMLNQTAEHVFDVRSSDWLGQPYHKVVDSESLVQFIQSIYSSEEKSREQIEWTKHFYTRTYDVYGAPVLTKSARLRGVTIVLHDVTEQKKLEQVRKDFVANVSHELKTPVTSIKGFAETLLDGALQEAQLAEQFTEIIWKESDRLQTLIADLLELSHIEHAHFALKLTPVVLADIVDEVKTLLLAKAEEKDIHLSVVTDGDTTIEADPQRVKQILLNLTSNAIAYTQPGGQVTMTIQEKEDHVLLQVADTGIGIAAENLARVFERFYRVDRDRSRHSGGTGLGLAIVKHLAEAHQAKIAVESMLGKGSTFTVTFLKKHR